MQSSYREAMPALRWNIEHLTGRLAQARFGTGGVLSVMSRAWLAWCLAELGEFEAVSGCVEQAIQTAEEADDPWGLGHVLFSYGCALALRGHLDDAIRILKRGLALSRDRDFPLLLTIIGGTLGYARVLSGDVQEGLALMEPAGRTVLSAWAAAAARATVWLGEAYLSAGRIDDAATAAKRAHDLALKRNEPGNQAWILRLLGEVALRGEPPELETARTRHEQGRVLAARLGMRPLEAFCHLGMGITDRRAQQLASAGGHLRTAATAFRAL